MYSAELNTFKKIDISYKTHPDLKIINCTQNDICFSSYVTSYIL